MASITLQGNPVNTVGELPAVGAAAPDFSLVRSDLSNVSLSDFAGKNLVLNIFPSIDTPVCASSVKAFNQKFSGLENTVVLCVSRDLPFAHKRFCGAEGIDQVECVSDFRDAEFGSKYGVTMTDGGIAGLFSRAIVVVDGEGKVTYTEQVPEIAQEPNYDDAVAVLS